MIKTLLNDVTLEGMRRVKVVSDAPIELAALPVSIVQPAEIRSWKDESLGLHYLEATWPCREAISVRLETWKAARSMVLWKMGPGERVSEQFKSALSVFGDRFKCWPAYAFMKKLPRGIENGYELDDVIFLEAEWVPAGCMAVCEGDLYGFEAMALQK